MFLYRFHAKYGWSEKRKEKKVGEGKGNPNCLLLTITSRFK